ncbi:M56 family metallopeptidase [Pedobacter sp. Hv1]|uniref:M56 family metallopeptidase n=1 Tax=Pedobacter sp. Hv1 TaxID=1740090 RepID=UPI000B067627|nr:M56 family metallopeptidase [Pedobacter sp. Hv1]
MIFYLLSVALILTACFIFYKVLLQQETFFPLNRFILIGCLALSFSIPFIPIPQEWSFRKANTQIERFIPLAPSNSIAAPENNTVSQPILKKSETVDTVAEKPSSFFKDLSFYEIMIWAYWLGVVIFAVNFIVQLGSLLYKAYSSPFIKDGRFRIIELSGNEAPCSFGNNIFINPEKYDWDTYSQILLHEKIHIQQGHSYDILFAELALIFQWFNPFAWLYRKAVEDNLEFLTDNELLAHSNIERASYQMSLVKVSVPRFPISLTTNYNQSILKKRLVMMNAKKSNVNSTWKYLFIFPLLLLFVALLNEPMAYGSANVKNNTADKFQPIDTEGTWFATIRNDQITIRFESDEDGKSNSSHTFSLSEFKNLPQNKEGNFTLTRDPGTIAFAGKFDGKTGMGTYKFNADATFLSFLAKEGVEAKDKDALVFCMVNLTKNFVNSLKAEGYTRFTKDDLIPLAALKIDVEYIRSLKNAGLTNTSLQDLIPLKALDIDGAYVKDIKNSGYKNVNAGNLITLKSQGIDGDFIKNAKASSGVSASSSTDNQMLALANEKGQKGSKGPKGDKNSNHDSDEDHTLDNLITKKVLNITPAFAKSFTDNGIKVSDEELIPLKTMGITADFFKEFENIGVKLEAEEAISLKSIGLTANEYTDYKKLGFKNLTLSDVISAKATGTSVSFISSMRKKGHDYTSIEKYVTMRVLSID